MLSLYGKGATKIEGTKKVMYRCFEGDRSMKKRKTSLIVFVTCICVVSMGGSAWGEWFTEPAWHNSGLSAQGDTIWDWQFADLVGTYIEAPGYLDMKFMFGQCYSGGFINDLIDFSDIAVSAAAQWDHTSSYEDTTGPPYWDGDYENYDSYAQRWTEWMSLNDPFSTQFDAHLAGLGYSDAVTEGAEFWCDVPLMEDARLDDGLSLHAILYVGGYNDADERDYFDYTTTMMYDALVGEYGYNPANIHVLFGSNPELAPGVNTYEATYDNLEFAFAEISLTMNPDEEFFFWSDDHGTFSIPEPGTLALLGMGGIALLRRRRK